MGLRNRPKRVEPADGALGEHRFRRSAMSSSGGASRRIISMERVLAGLGSSDECCPLARRNGTGTRQRIRGSDKGLWIPAFAGMTAPTLVRHSREGGNPVLLLWSFPVSSFTEHGCPAADVIAA